MLQKNTRCIKSRGWKLFEFEDQGKLYLICFRETCKYLLLLPKGSNKWKKIYISTKEKSWKSSSCFKSFQQPALNASCVLLEHQWMFEPFLIVVFESINCPQCERWISNHTVTAGKGSNMQKCWKTAESTERGGFVWRTVLSSNCSEQTRDSWTTNTKQKNSRGSSR